MFGVPDSVKYCPTEQKFSEVVVMALGTCLSSSLRHYLHTPSDTISSVVFLVCLLCPLLQKI